MSITYYERLKNKYDRQVYKSPEDKEYEMDRFLDHQEFLREKALYEQEIRRGKSVRLELSGIHILKKCQTCQVARNI